MFWLTILNYAIMFYTRGIHYIWMGYRMLKTFYDLQDWKFLAGCIVALSLMELINIHFIKDGFARTMKFYSLYTSKSIEEGDKTSTIKTKEHRLHLCKANSCKVHSSARMDPTHLKVLKVKRNWAKVRAAVLVGSALKKAQKDHAEGHCSHT